MIPTAAQIRKLMPGAKAAYVTAITSRWDLAVDAGVTTAGRINMFLSSIAVETGGLKLLTENLNYTTAARIRATWKTRFKTDAAARPYVRQPEKLANFVYGDRLGNRGSNTRDGWLFRGSGMLQTTGRSNFFALGEEYARNPDLLRDPETAFQSAVTEWDKRGCNAFADRGDTRGCRKAINGGTNGLAEFQDYVARGKEIFLEAQTLPTKAKVVSVPVAVEPTKVVSVPERSATETMRNVQQRLRDLGYPEVGNVDGKPGTKTSTAILAFRNEHGLPLTTEVDAPLLAALMTADHRVIPEARANATAKDLKGSKSVDIASTMKKAGLGLLGVSSVGGAIDVEDALSKFRSVSEIVSGIAPWVIGAVAGGIGIWLASKFIREQVRAYREGRHV